MKYKIHKNNNDLLFLLFCLNILSSLLIGSLPILILQIVFVSITIQLIRNKTRNRIRIYLLIYFTSLIFMTGLYYANIHYYGNSYYIGGSDDLSFEVWGNILYRNAIYDPSEVMKRSLLGQFHNSPFFASIIGMLIWFSELFGEYTTFIPRVANIHYLLWISIILEDLLTRYSDMDERVISSIIVVFALTPNIQFINSHVFRDTFNLLQIFLCIYSFDMLFRSKKIHVKVIMLLLILLNLYFMFYTRKNSVAIALVISLIIVIENSDLKKPLYLISIIFILSYLTRLTTMLDVNKFVVSYSNYVSSIAGDGLSSIVFNQPILPFGIFLRFAYGLISPFPNLFTLFKNFDRFYLDIFSLIISIGVIIQIILVPFLIKRLFRVDWIMLSFFTVYLIVIVSTFTFRHVILYFPFMVALTMDGYYDTKKSDRVLVLFFWITFIIVLAVCYLFLKG